MSNIKVIEKKGSLPGKTLVVLSGIHGDEFCGVKAFDNILPTLEITSGTVYFIYSNLEAIRQNKRFTEKNLNRCFLKQQPQDISETLEGKTAREIIPYLDIADAVLDIHASFTKDSIPFVICDEKWIETAGIFDSDITICNFDPFEPGSTDYYMNLRGKPGFCFECGFLEDFKTQKTAEKAIINFLIYFGAINGKVQMKRQTKLKLNRLYWNIRGPFKLVKYFKDFEKLNKKTLIGYDGNEKVYANTRNIILFARDRDKLNEECFLTAKELKNITKKQARMALNKLIYISENR
jgi:predicted deacylase